LTIQRDGADDFADTHGDFQGRMDFQVPPVIVWVTQAPLKSLARQ